MRSPRGDIQRDYVTIPEAMTKLHMGRTSIYKYVMPHVRAMRVGRIVRIHLGDLESWAENHTKHTL